MIHDGRPKYRCPGLEKADDRGRLANGHSAHRKLHKTCDRLQDEIQHMFSLSKAFFDLPADVKAKYRFDLVSPLVLYESLLTACFLYCIAKLEYQLRAE